MWRKGLILLFALTVGVAAFARTGAWVDEVVLFSQTDQAKAIEQMISGEADIYAYPVDNAEVFQKIVKSPELYYALSYGDFTELTFNPYPADPDVKVKEFKNGMLNPFADPKIREAMNWLVDRNYIVNELYKGLAIPRYLPITPTFPDYARYIDKARELEAKYAPNPEKAKKVITEEMQKLGAELKDGKWYYKGKPVTIIFLIRTEDIRKEIGDYVAGLLENLGFTVDRHYGTSRDLAPCWLFTDPAEGCFHVYTGMWGAGAISRDEGWVFDFFYTKRGLSVPLWQAYYVKPEADEVFKKLDYNDFSSLEERGQLFRKALDYAMENSVRIFLANNKTVCPMRKGLKLAVDLAAGAAGSRLWPYTIRWEKDGVPQAGGTVREATGEMFNNPWNPVAGSDWSYDLMPIDATSNPFVLPDPFTGLYRPERIKHAEVYVQKGLPVGKTLDWVDLEFVDEIEVPADAWYDWDAKAQKFITVGEAHPEGLTAKVKVVLHYDPQVFKDLWHDGSQFSMADILLHWILNFDRAKEDSPIYDESVVPDFQAFMEYFKGIKFHYNPNNADEPLVIEYYTDTWYLDAEWIAASAVIDAEYARGPGAWHAVAIGILAEANKEAAFSSDKAENLGVEWVNYVAGPTIDILAKYLDQALNEGYIPYEPVLSQFGVTKDEAIARYQNLKKWYEAKKHFWVGNGPFYLETVDPVAKTLTLKRFEQFADPSDKWVGFAEPKIAKIDFIGAPETLEIGQGAVIPVNITFKGEPYPADEISFVKWLLFDAEGNLVAEGKAEHFSGATWNVVLTPDITAKLPEGSAKLEVAVSSKVVAIPSYSNVLFVVVP